MMGMNTCHIRAKQATTNDSDEPRTMSSFSSGFNETDAMFLEFVEDLNNYSGGLSSMGDNSSVSNAFGVKKPILSHVVQFSQAIGVCVRKIFPICCLKCVNVGREYIEVLKGDLQHFKKYSDPKESTCQPTAHICGTYEGLTLPLRSLHESCILGGSSLTIIAMGRSRFYNDSTNSLRNENQMLELHSLPTPYGSQPLSRNEICETVLGR
ncbi:CACTA en-spm transposon protein [Cucumis melo var. makuwa]|uniref:CACTA en-spm transposon protein n=1 Tax=Cucumis melo var. makuwa TaxID=1194695 RepID=A0A5D3BW82_CUCMM|nr:CACTA en-spm transposon protein [Cucumis melo var. makuwa]TYK03228.1 CACTA en-spm transposon protein [Cucumis melo var. makuwa]